MSDIKPRSSDPEYVDTCLTNNPKMSALFTSYQNTLNLFPMESLIAYTNNYNKHVHDPVTAEKQFYENLNNQDELAVKLDYIDNEDFDEDVIKTDEYWSDVSGSDYASVKEAEYTAEPNFPWQLPDEKRAEEGNLKTVLDKDVQFILYWVEKFRCIHDTVKQEYYQTNPNNTPGGKYNKDNVYFNNFNESMFELHDTTFIKDRSTSLLLDTDNATGVISPYNRCQMKNIDIETYDTADELARITSSKFKKNMIKCGTDLEKDNKDIHWVINDPPLNSTATSYTSISKSSLHVKHETDQPHGNNLVVDNKHPVRVLANLETIQTKMNEILGDMKRVFDFLDKNTREDDTRWGKGNIKYFVEGLFRSVDTNLSELKVIGADVPLSKRKNQDLD